MWLLTVNQVLRKMQRRHSSNTDNGPPERASVTRYRMLGGLNVSDLLCFYSGGWKSKIKVWTGNRSQALSSEASVDEGGVFESLKAESASPPALFSGLPGLPAGSLPTTPFPSSLVLGASAGGGDVFIQMPASREEGGGRGEGGAYHHRQPHHHFHHSGHRGNALLQHVGGDHRAHSDEGGDEQPGTPAPALSELKAVVCWLQKGLPFILILLAKVCFQHKLGIAVCIGMASTFAYANSTLREQVSLKEKRSVLVILWILAFLAGNTLYVLYTFSSQQLYNSLIFLKPNLETLDFFDLLWIVGIADFVLKYVTIALKCLIVALPKIILAVKSKGKFYLVIEELSQLFRSLVPIQLWYKYIMGDDSSNSYFLGGVLIVLYSLCKSFDICGRVGGVRKALNLLCTSQNYGVRATGQQCTEAGDICAICQAEFREPLILMCQTPCGGNRDPLLQRRRWAQQGEKTDLPEVPLLLGSRTRAPDSRGQDAASCFEMFSRLHSKSRPFSRKCLGACCALCG
ncbi:RING finger and transmembrane domain-containing protein 2 isoform X2 [Ailuropoda melanoleuca]|uniref:RING finger and transmembrane domain-containing protein 2 isoform X2 n=1 Tax=Ailuropoda melanoleuca TaxID=9646 RepID=UPI001494BED2|nr:RING finger and transmembrane domain-containing protein 2 isoform X2 [Ailuropoda melanoleuca]